MKFVKGEKRQIAVIEGDECISKWVKESGRLDHDQNMLPIVLEYIPIGGVVLDIGTYIGDHTIAYADKVGKEGNVIGYEPSMEAYRCAFYNLIEYDNVSIERLAIGKENGTAKIEPVSGNDGMNYLVSGSGVTVKTLDQIFIVENNLDRIDFIKIDCEGYELDVLVGGAVTITKYKPVMLIEINEHTLSRNGINRKDIYLYLDLLGYEYRNVYAGQGLDEAQMDILCVPIDKSK